MSQLGTEIPTNLTYDIRQLIRSQGLPVRSADVDRLNNLAHDLIVELTHRAAEITRQNHEYYIKPENIAAAFEDVSLICICGLYHESIRISSVVNNSVT
jgi:histone H3/H4